MRKNPSPESGFLNPRIFLALLLCLCGAALAIVSLASNPSQGTISISNPNDTSSPSTSYSAGPFTQPNLSPVGAGQLDTGPRCDDTAFPCDTYHLTVTLPAGYTTAHPNATIKVIMSWTDAGSGNSDYDLYIYKLPRSDCFDSTGNPSADCTNTDGSESADSQSASGSNPEVANVAPRDGTTTYTIHIVPYTPTGETVNVTAQLLPGAPPDGGTGGGGSGGGTFGAADPTVAGNARFMNFYAPAGTSAEAAQGEFNIGFNPTTHRLMLMNIGPVWRLTLPEYLAQAKPECCEGLWEDVSPIQTTTGLDPILWTDQHSGRTMATNVTTGATVLYAVTDSDGDDNWVQPAAGLPNGGADHETIGTGPYPNIAPYNLPLGLGDPANPATHGHATYYCSQDIVGPAACYRSDSLGTAWGSPITLPYNGGIIPGTPPIITGSPCGGLHGHIHVAPDGSVWLPVNQCSGQQGGSFSTDGGTTWTQFTLPTTIDGVTGTGKSQGHGADPSIAIDHNSRIYYAYVNDQANSIEGHARVATGMLTGCTVAPLTGVRSGCSITWDKDFDIGATHGIVNAAEIEAVGDSAGPDDGASNRTLGVPGRAAVGFIGTNRSGDYQAGSFPGKWYAFIATTYDNGQSWTTTNASPNDPVQSMTGIWQQGGSGQNGDRNLLDFNEITVGDKGQVLYGYSDGCTSLDCVLGNSGSNLGAAMRVARQTGGRTLYAQFDSQYDGPNAPIKPKAPCLSGTRTPTESILEWKVPDNGGADIQYYKIYRSNASGAETFIGQTTDATPSYHDLNPPANPDLFYVVTAINSLGESVLSNEIDLVAIIPPLPQSPCLGTGVTVLTDPAGDTSAVLGVLGTPATPGSDLLALSVAEPYRPDNSEPRLVFTINTDPNPTGTEPPGWSAYAAMQIVNNGTTIYRGVRIYFNGTTPVFEYYTPAPNNSGGVDGRFVEAGSTHPAESGNYNAAAGIITIVVKISDLGLAVGDTIKGFVAGTGQSSDVANIGAGVTSLYDQMPDSLSFAGSFEVGPNSACAPLLSAVSRMVHHGDIGSDQTFDIPLPLTGPIGEETRGTGLTGNSYTVVLKMVGPVANAGTASLGQNNVGSASAAPGTNANEIAVTLTGVATAQHLTINLTGAQVTGAPAFGVISVPMDVLVGDTNQSRRVDNGDAIGVRNASGSVPSSSTFRLDINASNRVDNGDAIVVRNASGSALPVSPPASPAFTAQPRAIERVR